MANERARALRRNQTSAERMLWRMLRAKEEIGVRFRRQHPLGCYIVDFICLERSLIVEVDGGQHGDSPHQQYDRARDAWLESRGYLVLRFWNGEIYDAIDGVIVRIREALSARIDSPPPETCFASFDLPSRGR
ncbi:MAG: endonuclease domain-containing protein [Parvularculaceae bacterium]